ncbi:MAG: hypothetical protein K8R59_12915 [Thermoanaerobaculales bacterium]|nr:hypothetical protein [Thermoanaerobaculales bacterium]
MAIGFSVLTHAEEPKPTPTPEPTPAEAMRPKSLADLASGIRLQPVEGEESDSVVITNENLKSMGEGAVISEGMPLGGTPRLLSPISSRGGKAPGQGDIDGVKKEIENLQVQLSAINKTEVENQRVNIYNGSGPQYRPGGITDPLQNQRKEIERKISDVQSRLSEMGKATARADRANPPIS